MNAFLKTPLGICEVTGDIDGITSIKILDTDKEISQHIPEVLVPSTTQLKAYFNGELQELNFRINLQGTSFQKQVWEALLKIPYGETRSYLQLSKELGNVKAVRAVAAANGKNPLWIAVPCHRVIGSDGALTGYAGGLWRKKWLLELEKPSLQQELF